MAPDRRRWTTRSRNVSQTETIRSIATAALGGGFNPPAMLYAASDSVLYAVNPNKLMLDRLASFSEELYPC